MVGGVQKVVECSINMIRHIAISKLHEVIIDIPPATRSIKGLVENGSSIIKRTSKVALCATEEQAHKHKANMTEDAPVSYTHLTLPTICSV